MVGLTIIIAINQFFFVLSYRIAKDRFLERMMKEVPAIETEIGIISGKKNSNFNHFRKI